MKTLVGFLLIAILPLLIAVGVQAQPVDTLLKELADEDSELPWTLDADTMRYDDLTQQYVAEGNVVIQRDDLRVAADVIRFDYRAMQLIASGNIRVQAGEDELNGSRLELDLSNKTGVLSDGYLFLKENNFRIRGENIRKTGEQTYEIENASVTTCDGDPPDWSLSGKYIKVTIEGYGIVKGAALRARELPFLYTPYFIFPAKMKRQTGLLLPELGRSERWGYYINQPFFWAISDNTDATLYYNFMSERGHKLGGEYRYYASEASKGAWQFDYLYDRKVDNGIGDESEKWGYSDDDFLRPNHKRYWFRGGHYQPLPLGLRSRFEADLTSDQDYLVEFKEGYNGFDDTNDYLNKTFYRQIDDYTDNLRLNRLDLKRTWNRFNLDVDFRWLEDTAQRPSTAPDDTLQRLPLIEFTAAKQHLLTSFLYYDLNSNYNYFYREDGDRGHRLDLYPRLFLPVRLGHFVRVEPSVGLRETLWYLDPDDSDTGLESRDNSYNRQFYDVRIDLNSELYSIFPVSQNRYGIDRFKHTLAPRLTYNYVPDKNQEDLPEFDELDRLAAENLLTFSLTNFFFYRKAQDLPPANQPQQSADYRVHQLARFKLEQSYDIDEARRDDLTLDQQREPFSPLQAELEIWLNSYVYFDADAAWDWYNERLDSGNALISFTDKREDRLYLSYRFTRDQTESFLADLLVNINRAFAAGFEYERNIETGERLKTAVSLRYRSQCWGLYARYLTEPTDRKIEFAINLIGLGEAGGSF